MLKKSITYTDFNDQEVTEDFYFHLSKADLIEMEMSHKGGYEKWLKKIMDAEDGATLISEFKKLILTTYGQKSADNARFIRSQELRDEFESSEAFSTLFVELITNAEVAAEFVNGVVPKGLQDDVAKIRPQETRTHPSDTAATPAPISEQTGSVMDALSAVAEPQLLTTDEAAEMLALRPEELQDGLATGRYKLS